MVTAALSQHRRTTLRQHTVLITPLEPSRSAGDGDDIEAEGNCRAQAGKIRRKHFEHRHASLASINRHLRHTDHLQLAGFTRRWLLPLRAIWSAGGDGILCGGMDRSCKIFDAEDGRLLAAHKEPELLTAVPSRNATHRSKAAIACATASGRVFVFRDQ